MHGFTDYTLAKRAVLESLRRGGLRRLDVCDAHPELIRAARNIGDSIVRPCPVCGQQALRLVRYVYGDQLKELSGRPVYPKGWEAELAKRVDEFRCYSVEVCLECEWNHLAACYLMGKQYAQPPPSLRSAARRRKSG